ncbi:MAG: TlpA family protein disulfide reductase [Prevotella sp.]
MNKNRGFCGIDGIMTWHHIVTTVLVLVSMTGMAQTKTATIMGYSPALKDGTSAVAFINNVSIANDTVKGGHFTLTVPVEGLTNSSLSLEGEGCPTSFVDIWLRPGVEVRMTGTDCLYPLWKMDSPVSEQLTLNRITEHRHDTSAEILRLNLANATWEEERPVFMKYLKQTMDILPSLPVDAASLNELESVAMMAREYKEDFPYMEQLRELEASTAARAPKGFEEQLAQINSEVYPPHVLQVGEEATDAELIDMQGQKRRLSEYLGQPGRYVLLDFWSLACGPCRIAEPEMRLAYEQSQGKLEIIGINQDNLAIWQKDSFSKSIVWKNWNDGKMGKADIVKHYCDMRATPYYVLISPEKQILWKSAGYGLGSFLGMLCAINGPKQDNSSNLSFAVRHIDVDSDRTKVDFRYFTRKGYWFRIVNSSYLEANGRKYKLTAAEGVKLDEDNYPDQKATEATEGLLSGLYYKDFTLTFEPFESIPESFNFIEGDIERAFVIRNIMIGKTERFR